MHPFQNRSRTAFHQKSKPVARDLVLNFHISALPMIRSQVYRVYEVAGSAFPSLCEESVSAQWKPCKKGLKRPPFAPLLSLCLPKATCRFQSSPGKVTARWAESGAVWVAPSIARLSFSR